MAPLQSSDSSLRDLCSSSLDSTIMPYMYDPTDYTRQRMNNEPNPKSGQSIDRWRFYGQHIPRDAREISKWYSLGDQVTISLDPGNLKYLLGLQDNLTAGRVWQRPVRAHPSDCKEACFIVKLNDDCYPSDCARPNLLYVPAGGAYTWLGDNGGRIIEKASSTLLRTGGFPTHWHRTGGGPELFTTVY